MAFLSVGLLFDLEAHRHRRKTAAAEGFSWWLSMRDQTKSEAERPRLNLSRPTVWYQDQRELALSGLDTKIMVSKTISQPITHNPIFLFSNLQFISLPKRVSRRDGLVPRSRGNRPTVTKAM